MATPGRQTLAEVSSQNLSWQDVLDSATAQANAARAIFEWSIAEQLVVTRAHARGPRKFKQ